MKERLKSENWRIGYSQTFCLRVITASFSAVDNSKLSGCVSLVKFESGAAISAPFLIKSLNILLNQEIVLLAFC